MLALSKKLTLAKNMVAANPVAGKKPMFAKGPMIPKKPSSPWNLASSKKLDPFEEGALSGKPGPFQKARVAVIISGSGTNLQALLDQERAGNLPHVDITLVVADNENAGGITRSKKAGVKTVVIPRRKKKASGKTPTRPSNFEASLLDVLQENDIDMLVLAGFLGILSADFFVNFRGPVINVHPSLIPAFCGKGFYGLHVHEAALRAGVKVSGATVHFVNEMVDGGKIIAQKAVAVKEGDTPETLQRRIMEKAEWILLPQATESVAASVCAAR